MEILQNSNAVWEHKKLDPPHVNTMKKAELTSSDGKHAYTFNLCQTLHCGFVIHVFPFIIHRHITKGTDTRFAGNNADTDHVHVGTNAAKFCGRRRDRTAQYTVHGRRST